MGAFPLFPVSQFREKLPADMTAKGGLFFPMCQREAMWINFDSEDIFAIKIYVGGVNVISREPAIENITTKLRHQNLLHQSDEICQDYIVTPTQRWVDGIAGIYGQVRQFVAMPTGSGYSIEAQVTGEEAVGGLQFEVTPAILPEPKTIFVKTLTGRIITIECNSFMTVLDLKDRIEEKEGIPSHTQRLLFIGDQLKDDDTLQECFLPNECTIHLFLRMAGGEVRSEMGVAAGGAIRQSIKRDRVPPGFWIPEGAIAFNVQILNTLNFREATALEPPPSPIYAETYASEGLPFFKLWGDESAAVGGNLDTISSVAHRDNKVDPSLKFPIVELNPKGPRRKFRPIENMRKETAEARAVQF